MRRFLVSLERVEESRVVIDAPNPAVVEAFVKKRYLNEDVTVVTGYTDYSLRSVSPVSANSKEKPALTIDEDGKEVLSFIREYDAPGVLQMKAQDGEDVESMLVRETIQNSQCPQSFRDSPKRVESVRFEGKYYRVTLTVPEGG